MGQLRHSGDAGADGIVDGHRPFDRNLGTLLLASKDGGKVDRIPSSLEVQKFFDGVVVTLDEITSDAERAAMAYGDSDLLERERARKAVR